MTTTQSAAAQIVTQLAQGYATSHREVGSLADRSSIIVAGRPGPTTRRVTGKGDAAGAGLTPSQDSLLSTAVSAGSASTNGQVPYQTYNSQYPIAPASLTGATAGSGAAALASPGPHQAPGIGPGKGLGGIGGIGKGLGGLGGGLGGADPAAATAAPEFTGGGSGSGLVAAAAAGLPLAAGAAAAAGGAGMSGMPYLPFMGFGGAGGAAGGGSEGGNRRVPSWLVETEDVWGESAPVAPAVIGEDPSAGPTLRR